MASAAPRIRAPDLRCERKGTDAVEKFWLHRLVAMNFQPGSFDDAMIIDVLEKLVDRLAAVEHECLVDLAVRANDGNITQWLRHEFVPHGEQLAT